MFELRMKYPATKDLVTRYTQGDCYVLAPEIHKLTGWKIAIQHNADRNGFKTLSDESAWYSCHVFCVSPCGQFALDINGLTPLKEIKDEWVDKCGARHFFVCKDLETYEKIMAVWPDITSQEKSLARKTAKRICNKILHPKK